MRKPQETCFAFMFTFNDAVLDTSLQLIPEVSWQPGNHTPHRESQPYTFFHVSVREKSAKATSTKNRPIQIQGRQKPNNQQKMASQMFCESGRPFLFNGVGGWMLCFRSVQEFTSLGLVGSIIAAFKLDFNLEMKCKFCSNHQKREQFSLSSNVSICISLESVKKLKLSACTSVSHGTTIFHKQNTRGGKVELCDCLLQSYHFWFSGVVVSPKMPE